MFYAHPAFMNTLPHASICGLILTLALTLTAPPAGLGEDLVVLVVPPRVDLARDSAFSEPQAKSFNLIRVGPRVGVSGKSPFGKDQKEDFQQFDVAAIFGLPWGWQERSYGLKFDMRLLASAGQLSAAQETSLMATLVPGLAVSSPNGVVTIDAGAGAGFFSNYKFGVQNFGGPVQIVGTASIGLNPFSGFYAGYRFQHFSDAGIYGSSSLGVDMHILEISYRF